MVNHVRALKKSLGILDAESAARLVSASSDIALVVDKAGIIEDISFGSSDLSREGVASWIGRPWVDTVTDESRAKVEELLRDAGTRTTPFWREVNHPSLRGSDLPVSYSTLQVGEKGRVVALGRELRAMATLQQRLIESQQSMEREYSRLRHAETRYRVLFQMAAEPVLIIDAATLRVVEANPAAGHLFAKMSARRIVGRDFLDIVDPSSVQAAENLLETIKSTGRADDVRLQLAGESEDVIISSSLFRQANASHLLLRMTPARSESARVDLPQAMLSLQKVVERLPDGFVVTELDQTILTANAAFLDLAQLASVEQARGRQLEQWLGRSSVDLNVMIANLREHGSVRQFATILRGQYGSVEDIEISAVAVTGGEQPCFGFTIRQVGQRPQAIETAGREVPRSVKQLTELVGRVPLKSLVRESTDLIERLCIEAALELVGDNRASAAEMLGLSRQSLYVKLRRYGISDGGADE